MFKFWMRLVGETQSEQQAKGEATPAPVSLSPYPQMLAESEHQGRSHIFDPALIPGLAIRLGPPELLAPEIKAIWRTARREVLDHLLWLVTRSVWGNHLVLRGSLLLTAWFGDAAREPGDIDWVFRPIDVEINSPECQTLFSDLIQMISDQPKAGRATIQANGITTKDIWTYERAMGRRLVVPWLVDNTLPGEVQMDIVFSEELFAEPVQTLMPAPDGSSIMTWTANKELSLAWKLLWLLTDHHRQGKDLYDATLLAEQTSLSIDLLHRVLKTDQGMSSKKLAPDFPMKWAVNWDNFKLEYPEVQGEAIDWQMRLAKALAPLFEDRRMK